jgi:protein ImuA
MTNARMRTLASLRGAICRLEAETMPHDAQRVALGHADADTLLQGGLMRGVLHEVFATQTRQSAAATGFVAGIAERLAKQRTLLWVRQDFVEREAGILSMSGLAELGLDPRRLVLVRATDAEAALRVAADGLACDALGAVVLDLWGEVRTFDLVASRKLTMAAQTSGVPCVMLRTSALPEVSTAETRWIIRAARSPPVPEWSAWGSPVLDAELVRNRHGQTGQWIMEWNCDECLFREPAAYSQPVVAAPADRPHQAPVVARGEIARFNRRAG